jgi:hypothetical protein
LGDCSYFFENYRSIQTIGSTLFHCKSYVFIGTKIGWATFWAIFSPTHLVTLSLVKKTCFEEPLLSQSYPKDEAERGFTNFSDFLSKIGGCR